MAEQSNFIVRKAAVLGAGVMGAQIAAQLVNAGVQAILFELPAKEGDPNGNVKKAIEGLRKLEPSPIAVPEKLAAIMPANYEQHLELLKGCELIIEAVAERMDIKQALYEKVAPHLAQNAIFASNTSGLSITALAGVLPEKMKRSFCGIHFFNPPRYMNLVELIPHAGTEPKMLDQLESFLVTTLGKGVVRAKDTPNFIANRVGVFSILATMHHGQQFGLGFDEVDVLTGPYIGRPKSATFRTADVVGLDTLAHVVRTMTDALPNDPWHPHYQVPPVMQALIAKGALGQKTRAGFYRKPGKDIEVFDPAKQDYRLSGGEVKADVKAILKNKNPAEQFAQLRASSEPQAQFLWACFRDVFHYCAVHLASIADNARDLDLAIRWGFGWNTGPFETWQAAGWQQVAQWISEDIAAGKAMAKAPLPAWVTESARQGVHGPNGSWAPATQSYQPRSALAVYRRQAFPDALLGEKRERGTTIFETDGVRCWHTGDDVAIVSFKSKMHAIGEDVLDGLLRSIEEAEKNCAGLVIWQTEPPFSVGANLMSMAPALMMGQWKAIENVVAKFQRTSQALKYSMVPTVAAMQGMALGGGCEFPMHCAKTVAALESYIGLVETGVGLIPAGGGCKEIAVRAARNAPNGDPFPAIQKAFQTIAMAEVAKSATHAQQYGFLRPSDTVVMNAFELLHVAKAEVRALSEAGYRPPLPQKDIPVAGKTGLATLKMALVNMRDGGFISEHDFEIGARLAEALCGGQVEAGSLVDENWLLTIERKHFVELLRMQKTQARIKHMLETGKPLRN
jgi:3-hydroxyacyl-CoA dehydrogenase